MTDASIEGGGLTAKVRQVDVDRSGEWLRAGWQDFQKAPKASLMYGGAFVLLSYALTLGLFQAGLESLIPPLLGGFLLVAPVLVVGLYEISRRLEMGEPITPGEVWQACQANLGQIAAFGLVLAVGFMVWLEISIFLFALFFNQQPPPLDRFLEEIFFTLNGAPFLIVGTVVGGGIAFAMFSISVVSVPLLLDRKIDVLTAIATSVMAVRVNWQTMFGWSAMIGIVMAAGLVTFYLGLAIAMPVLAYASWHAYKDMVE